MADHRCECGCGWVLAPKNAVKIEVMPEHLRSSHTAARNKGVYPFNGAHRLWVDRRCAERMVAEAPEWCAPVASGRLDDEDGPDDLD